MAAYNGIYQCLSICRRLFVRLFSIPVERLFDERRLSQTYRTSFIGTWKGARLSYRVKVRNIFRNKNRTPRSGATAEKKTCTQSAKWHVTRLR